MMLYSLQWCDIEGCQKQKEVPVYMSYMIPQTISCIVHIHIFLRDNKYFVLKYIRRKLCIYRISDSCIILNFIQLQILSPNSHIAIKNLFFTMQVNIEIILYADLPQSEF